MKTSTSTARTVHKNDDTKKILSLVEEIRGRLEGGHYDFMTWNGRTNLGSKLRDYENYAKEPHRSRVAATISTEKHKLSGMEAELRALLGSTY